MGWQGDRALARLGYTASIALRTAFGIFNVEWAARDQSTGQFIEERHRSSDEEISDVMRGLRKYVLACADEARQLMTLPAITK